MQKLSKTVINEYCKMELVFSTENCAINQDDNRCDFLVMLFNQSFRLKMCGLINFKRKIDHLNVDDIMRSQHPTEILYISQLDRLFLFDCHQIIELKNLIDGTFTLLQLNSIIHYSKIRK